MSASGTLPMTITKCNRTLKCLFVKRYKNNIISVSGLDQTTKKAKKANNNNALRCLMLFQLCKHAIKTCDFRKQLKVWTCKPPIPVKLSGLTIITPALVQKKTMQSRQHCRRPFCYPNSRIRVANIVFKKSLETSRSA